VTDEEHASSRSGEQSSPRTPNAGAASDVATSVAGGALLLAASNLLSRILGYGRDIVLGGLEGSSPAAGAYFAAFQIPDLLNYLLAGGALSIAFLPIYTRARLESEASARHLLGIVLGSLSIAAALATALLWWQADWVTAQLYPRFDPEIARLTTELTRIVLPAQILFVIGGILNATLLARGRFWAAALAPLLYNASIITLGLLLHARLGVRSFALGVLVGAMAGPFAAPLVACLRARVPLGFQFAPLDRTFRSYLFIAAPLMLGQSLLTVDEWFDRLFGALIGPDVVAWLSYARKLMLVPVAVVGQAIAAAALPTLARLYGAGKLAELNQSLLDSLRAGLGLGVLLSIPLATFAKPIIVLVYERGEFGSGDSQQVAALLQLLALAAPSWILQQILVRGFYARGDTWSPMLLGTLMVGLALPVYWWLAQALGASGLALAGALAMGANVLATLALARRMHRAPPLRALLDSLLRSLAIALGGSGVAIAICSASFGSGSWMLADQSLDTRASWQLFLLGGLCYAFTALPLAARWGDAPTRATLARVGSALRRRTRRQRAPAPHR